jgi:hypothetical protein
VLQKQKNKSTGNRRKEKDFSSFLGAKLAAPKAAACRHSPDIHPTFVDNQSVTLFSKLACGITSASPKK